MTRFRDLDVSKHYTMGLRLNIEQPCHENWDNMELGLISRNCSKCEKAVYDFTQMNRKEILEFILLNQHQGFCGRFNAMQLDFTQVEIETSVSEILSRNLKPLQRELILTMSVLLLSACNTNPPADSYTETNSMVTKDSLQSNEQTDTFYMREWMILGELSIPGEEKEVYAYQETVGDSSILEMEEIVIKSNKHPRAAEVEVWMGIPRIYTGSRARFNGTHDSLNRFINLLLKKETSKLDSGVVIPVQLQFKVTKRGKIRRVRVLNSNNQYAELEQKACKAIKKSKSWEPMRNAKNKKVNSLYTSTIYLKKTE
mgnify:CR=1 FL=1